MDTRYEVDISTEELTFCAAHFITYGGGNCESLHGHNYRLRVTVSGELDRHGMIHDFLDLRGRLRALTDRLDHRTLLPDSNPTLAVERQEGAVIVRRSTDGAEYRFPEEDVVVLPVENTTAELLAGWMAEELEEDLEEAGAELASIRVEVVEAPGQAAACVRH